MTTIAYQNVRVQRGKAAAWKIFFAEDDILDDYADLSSATAFRVSIHMFDQRLSEDPVDIQGATSDLDDSIANVAIGAGETLLMSPIARWECLLEASEDAGETWETLSLVRGKIICEKVLDATISDAVMYVSTANPSANAAGDKSELDTYFA